MSRYIAPPVLGAIVAVLASTTASLAQAPDSVSFQGRLTDSGGGPIFASGLPVTFAMYKGGTKIWEETQYLEVENGLFSVLLGAVTPLDTIKFNVPIELGIKVDEDLEMSPKTPLASAAYARALPGFYTYYHDDLSGDKSRNVVGGADNNYVSSGITGATISGGGGTASNSFAGNQIQNHFGSIGGGGGNTVSGAFSTIPGGAGNSASGYYAAIGGGINNTNSGYATTVAGGSVNAAPGNQATIGGGNHNKASASLSTVSGGELNTASGAYSVIPGGTNNRATGEYSFAAGYNARAKHNGSFVWNDRSVTSDDDSLLSTAENQFVIRAAGGFGLNQAPTNYGLYIKQRPSGTETHHLMGIRMEFGSNTDYWDVYQDLAGHFNFDFDGVLKAYIDDADGSYHAVSDASLKEDVQPFRSSLGQVLRLHPATYRFKDHPDAPKRSLGLIAQEVEPYFPELVAEKDGIKTMNYSGLSVVAIKAIQELYAEFQRQLTEQRELILDQEREIERLSRIIRAQ